MMYHFVTTVYYKKAENVHIDRIAEVVPNYAF